MVNSFQSDGAIRARGGFGLRLAVGSTMLALLWLSSGDGPVASQEAATQDPALVDRLARATKAREAASETLASKRATYEAESAQANQLSADQAQIAAELEVARRELRDTVVRAFVDSGGGDQVLQILAGQDPADASRRLYFGTSGATDIADKADRLKALKEGNDPELARRAERLADLSLAVTEAENSLVQASAQEADAERALAQASADQALAAAQAAREKNSGRDGETSTSGSPAAPAPGPTTSPVGPSGSGPPGVSTGPSATTPGEIVPLTELSAPLAPIPAGGPSDSAWAALRKCESGGNYRAVSPSGRYRGAYQFDRQTWQSVGGAGDPAAALPIEQDGRAKLLYFGRGPKVWPVCGRALVESAPATSTTSTTAPSTAPSSE